MSMYSRREKAQFRKMAKMSMYSRHEKAQFRKMAKMPMYSRHEKAQMISYEIMFALTVFLVLAGVTIINFSNVVKEITQSERDESLRFQALHAMNQLMETAGQPGNWETLSSVGDYNKIGLAWKPRNLSQAKINKFNDLNYDTVSDKLNLGSSYYFKLVQDANTVISKGTDSDINTARAFTVTRIAILDDEYAAASLKVFE